MADGIEIRIFFSGSDAVEGSHSRHFPVVPVIGQTLVFGGKTGDIAVFDVIETGFFLWDEGASLWIRVKRKDGEHRAPAGYYDPIVQRL